MRKELKVYQKSFENTRKTEWSTKIWMKSNQKFEKRPVMKIDKSWSIESTLTKSHHTIEVKFLSYNLNRVCHPTKQNASPARFGSGHSWDLFPQNWKSKITCVSSMWLSVASTLTLPTLPQNSPVRNLDVALSVIFGAY